MFCHNDIKTETKNGTDEIIVDMQKCHQSEVYNQISGAHGPQQQQNPYCCPALWKDVKYKANKQAKKQTDSYI